MKKTVFVIIVSICSMLKVSGYAQSLPENSFFTGDLHQIRQVDGTNKNILDFFSQTGIMFYSDTAYCIIIPPMMCSRCEGVINPFIFELEKIDPDAMVIVFAYYPKTAALRHYLEQRQFRADHTIASSDPGFLENFHFSTDEIQVPYITKLNISTGDLLVGKSTLGLEMNTEFVHRLRAFKGPITKYNIENSYDSDYQASAPVIDLKNSVLPISQPYSEMLLGEEEGYPISRVLFPSFNDELSYFSFMDELSYTIYLYHISDGCLSFVQGIAPGKDEERLFIDPAINDTLLLLLKKMNIINSMYFSSTFIGDSIVVTSSLPFIFFEDSTKEKLAYYNKSTFLYRIIGKDSIKRYVTPEPLPDSNLTLEHLKTQYIQSGKYIIIPVSKGWPVSGTEMLEEVAAEDNPFLETFYNQAPVVAIYDNQGNFISYFGQLPEYYEDMCLGFSFSRPMVRDHEGIFWYADKYLGKIYGYKGLDQQKHNFIVNVFEIPEYQSDIDPSTQPLDYIRDHKKVFSQSILDFQVLKDTVYVVTGHDDFYFYKKYHTGGKLISQSLLPSIYDNMEAKHFILNVNHAPQRLLGIYESAELTSIYLFR
jgi:hypothetical protein